MLSSPYRYDPTDFNCEALSFARDRAHVFYRNHRRRFNGEYEDLEQIAMMAVVEAVRNQEDQSNVEETVMIAAVDKELSAGIKKNKKQSIVADGEDGSIDVNYLPQQPEYKFDEATEATLALFQKRITLELTRELVDILFSVMILGYSLEDKLAEINAKRTGPRQKPLPLIYIKKKLREAIENLRNRFTENDLKGMLKISAARDLIK